MIMTYRKKIKKDLSQNNQFKILTFSMLQEIQAELLKVKQLKNKNNFLTALNKTQNLKCMRL